MINKYEIKLECQSKESPNCFWGYNLYGALMQKLTPDTVDYLHVSGMSPLSQYITIDKTGNIITWHVTVVGDINQQIEDVLYLTKEYHLERHDAFIKVSDYAKVSEISKLDFAKMYLHEKPFSRRIRINTFTPVSFKSDGEYALFPSVEHIYKSAVQKWNAFNRNVTVEDDTTLKQLIESTQIVSYRLNSFYYQIKGVKIPSFYGEMTLFIKGPEALVRLANLLLNYLNFSGLGIKCALGMGGIKITDCKEQSASNKKEMEN
jgi:CRISPR-associated endoribonuclease Cas6